MNYYFLLVFNLYYAKQLLIIHTDTHGKIISIIFQKSSVSLPLREFYKGLPLLGT